MGAPAICLMVILTALAMGDGDPNCHLVITTDQNYISKTKVSLHPTFYQTIAQRFGGLGRMETTLFCNQDEVQFKPFTFVSHGEEIKCTCMTQYCLQEKAGIERDAGNESWVPVKSVQKNHGGVMEITASRTQLYSTAYRCVFQFVDDTEFRLDIVMLKGILVILVISMTLTVSHFVFSVFNHSKTTAGTGSRN